VGTGLGEGDGVSGGGIVVLLRREVGRVKRRPEVPRPPRPPRLPGAERSFELACGVCAVRDAQGSEEIGWRLEETGVSWGSASIES